MPFKLLDRSIFIDSYVEDVANVGEVHTQIFTLLDETIRIDSGSTYEYYGFADPGSATSSGVWKIIRMTIADCTVLYADGDSNYDNIWDNRASLSYS